MEGLLKGKNAITEIMKMEVYVFSGTDNPDLYYMWSGGEENMMWPKIVDGKPVLFTLDQIEELKKRPNCFCALELFTPVADGIAYYLTLLEEALKVYNESKSGNDVALH
jgi:hypothetical protein